MDEAIDYYDAVASQPAELRKSAASIRSCLETVDLRPWLRGTLAVAGMGAASHAGRALVHRLGRRGRRAVHIDASELIGLGPRADVADCYLFVSQGGRSRETIVAAQAAPLGARLALTNAPDAPLLHHVDAPLLLGAGHDSRVYTVGYTAMLQAFGMLAQALDGTDDGDDWERLPDRVERTLTVLAEPARRAAAALAGSVSLDLVGAGPSRASADEAALLIRESARIRTASFETYQYLHGPMESLTGADGCVLFGQDREIRLARYLAGRGVPTVLITPAVVAPEPGLTVLTVPTDAAVSAAVLEILPAQLLAGELAAARGLGIDGFIHHQDDTKIES
ncbi:SIS domain-containing protein OS=Streptomyces alboniger OX=132473 GN=CP975_23865 PE=4 SV=1 [Streptomyces alboniger]